MTIKKVNIIGYLSGDSLYRHNFQDFIDKYSGRDFYPNGINGDQKVDIMPGTAKQFTFFLNNSNGDIEDAIPGGGGENSREAFKRLGVPCFYIDTCNRPDFVPDLTEQNSYFGGMCYPGLSLVIPTTQGSGAGTFILKSGRGDIDKDLRSDFRERVNEQLNQGDDVLVSSLSSEPLARLVANNKGRGDLYAVVTTYLPRNSQGLNDTLKVARASIFSFKEFYWALDDEGKYNQLATEPFTKEKAEEIANDMSLYANTKRITGSLMVTLGQHGALHYYRNNGKSKSWVHLQDNTRKNIQVFLRKNNRDTKSAGDKFTAGTIHALQQDKSLEEAVMAGSEFAIKNVLGYPDVTEENFKVEYLAKKRSSLRFSKCGKPTWRIPLTPTQQAD